MYESRYTLDEFKHKLHRATAAKPLLVQDTSFKGDYNGRDVFRLTHKLDRKTARGGYPPEINGRFFVSESGLVTVTFYLTPRSIHGPIAGVFFGAGIIFSVINLIILRLVSSGAPFIGGAFFVAAGLPLLSAWYGKKEVKDAFIGEFSLYRPKTEK